MTSVRKGTPRPGPKTDADRERRRPANAPESIREGTLTDFIALDLVERMNDGLVVVDERHRITFVNPKLRELLGIPLDEMLGRSPADFLDETSRAVFKAQVETRARGGKEPYEITWVTRSGRPLVTIVTPQPIFDPAGKHKGSFAVLTDITERTKAEALLKDDVERLRHILEETSGGVWDWNIITGAAVFSPKYSRMLGYEPEEFARHYDEWGVIVHPDDIERVKQAHADHFEKGKTFSVEFRMREKSGGWHWIHSRGILLERDDHGRPLRMVGTHQDIQERKNGELAIDRLRGELAVANRRIMLGELTSSLAHELNQPLGAILNNAEAGRVLVERSRLDRDEIREIFGDIIRDDVRAGEVIRKIRGMIKGQEMNFEPLAVGQLIQDVVDMARGSLSLNNIRMRLELGQALPPVLGDRVHLQQVLLNLLTNAVDAMHETPEKNLLLRAVEKDVRTVEVSVVDSGPGVGPQAAERIFKPFYTTKPNGLGLGLSICRTLIEAHGGRIWAESRPAAGAAFSFSLKTGPTPGS